MSGGPSVHEATPSRVFARWDPDRYEDFAAERARPFDDLLARIPAPGPGVVVDLGCGTGARTAELADRWPFARVLGLDSSVTMLEAAQRRSRPGRLTFLRTDVREWQPDEPVDVLVSNAVLHWVPDHLDLLPAWVDGLAPGGWLALQVPATYDAPLHALLRGTASRPPFADALEAAGLPGGEGQAGPVPAPVDYLETVAAAGARVDAWETTYLHVLDPDGRFGDDAVLAWARGTLLRPALTALEEEADLRDAFLDAYGAALREAYPRRPWGTPLPYRRVFVVAQRE